MSLALGGPGVACSALRVRRLLAGELAGDERARTEAHLAGCERCRATGREIAAERARLEAELPFDAFAAGVAERLARAAPRRRVARAWPAALAAGILLALALPTVLRVRDDRGGRPKGGADLALFVREGAAARALGPDEPIPPGGTLRLVLSTGGRRFVAVALLDADGAVVLHAGPAVAGPLPGAFEWTGAGEGALVAVLADAPVDGAALAARLAHGGVGAASPGGGAEVVVRMLRRTR